MGRAVQEPEPRGNYCLFSVAASCRCSLADLSAFSRAFCATLSPLFQPGPAQAGGWMDAPETKSLPENAYRPLAPGEIYAPIVPAATEVEEATFRSVGWGLFLCI